MRKCENDNEFVVNAEHLEVASIYVYTRFYVKIFLVIFCDNLFEIDLLVAW